MSTEGTFVPPHLRVPFAGVTPAPTQEEGQKLFPTGNWRFFRPVYRDKTPPCNNACPTGEKIQKYLDLVKHGRYLEAYQTIKEDNPMPSITGRVCYHPCETACNRGSHDEPIGIRSVERFLGDFGLALADDVVQATPPNGRRVAVVGSGPGGLACAYHLARKGYQVTIFEKMSKPGGMMRGGIPEWHLPQAVLDQEIDRIVSLGVEIRCNTAVGKDISWDDLKRYDAAFVAIGQDIGRRLPVPGMDGPGVIGGVEYLRDIVMEHEFVTGKQVIVIGGGNTALDCARSAVRLGAPRATMVALEARDEMPAIEEDVLQAIEEGCEFVNNRAVVEVIRGERGAIAGVRLNRAALDKDENGGVRPKIFEGTDELMEADTLIVAIGQVQNLDWVPKHLVQRGLLKADEFGRVEGNIFAGGDVVRGPGMVVQALGDGKKAAQNIDEALNAVELAPPPPPNVIYYDRLNPYYFQRAPRVTIPIVPAAERRGSQTVEVTLAYNEEQAQAESDRCMSCGVCNGCDNCYIVCPDVCVERDERKNGLYQIKVEYCKGCLVCVQECPTGCLEKAPELDFEDGVVRMETAFQVTRDAHARQADDIARLMQEAIAEADAARKIPAD